MKCKRSQAPHVSVEFVKALRESVCLDTRFIEIRCDNKAAIVLATGEGSWRTKALANKVYNIREQVEHGTASVNYVESSLQSADSLTKFMKSAPIQARACSQLAMTHVGEHGRLGHVRNAVDQVRVCRIFVPETENLVKMRFLIPQRFLLTSL